MRNDEIGIVHLDIHGYGCQHHSGESTDQEHEKESEAPQHWQSHLHVTVPDRGQPAEELDASRNDDHQARRREKAFTQLRQAGGEHVMDPHAEANETSSYDRDDDGSVSEDPAPAET